MEIKDGYNQKSLKLRFSQSGNGRCSEVWVTQEGLPDTPEFGKYRETLSYATVDELIDLKKEVEDVLKDIIGI